MHCIIAQFSDGAQAQAILDAVKTAAPGAFVQHFYEIPMPLVPNGPAEEDIDSQLVAQVADVVRSAPRSVVLGLLYGDDSWSMSRGDYKASIRPDTIALSRRLRPLFPLLASPIDALVVREREYFPEGGYKGIRYSPTPLGIAVREALRTENIA